MTTDTWEPPPAPTNTPFLSARLLLHGSPADRRRCQLHSLQTNDANKHGRLVRRQSRVIGPTRSRQWRRWCCDHIHTYICIYKYVCMYMCLWLWLTAAVGAQHVDGSDWRSSHVTCVLLSYRPASQRQKQEENRLNRRLSRWGDTWEESTQITLKKIKCH